MGCRRMGFGCLGVLAWALVGGAANAASAPAPAEAAPRPIASEPASAFVPAPLLLDDLPDEAREEIRAVIEQPTLAAQGPVEVFGCRPETYQWLTDHPNQTARLWRRLGAKVVDIQEQGDGRFGWHDDNGSEMHWRTVVKTPRRRVWYAEGRIRPGMLLPAVPVQAVVVLNFVEGHDGAGRTAVRHQTELFVHTDSKAVVLATRLMGSSAPHLAEQFLGQLQMFYAAMAWYLDRHPDQAESFFADLKNPESRETRPATGH